MVTRAQLDTCSVVLFVDMLHLCGSTASLNKEMIDPMMCA